MPWGTIIGQILKALLAGGFKRWWEERKVNKKVQAIANIPETDKEWSDAAKNSGL